MNIKLFIADIDMTLVNSEKKIMPLTRQALVELRKQGVMIGIASGRPIYGHLLSRYENWQLDRQLDVIIGMNGGQLYDASDESFSESYKLKKEYIKEIYDLMAPLNLNPFVYKKDHMLVTRMDEQTKASSIRNKEPAIVAENPEELWAVDNGKILFRAPDKETMDKMLVLADSHPSPYYQHFLTSPLMMEFQDARINKGLALSQFCRKHGIKKEEVIAFGDAANDIPLLKEAGIAVAMQNGTDEIKKIATCVTDYDYNNDGVGHFLYDHILKKA